MLKCLRFSPTCAAALFAAIKADFPVNAKSRLAIGDGGQKSSGCPRLVCRQSPECRGWGISARVVSTYSVCQKIKGAVFSGYLKGEK
jgi:hypothetical protein